MKQIDILYTKIRKELLKEFNNGNILDLGAGGGIYLKYSFYNYLGKLFSYQLS